MSYLSALRLHFAGRFQANVSTVNNDPAHFDNATFQASYQEMQTSTAPNGWFSPQGDAAWRFLGCAVTSAWMPGGPVAHTDPVLGCIIADSDDRVPAKLADLDSEQQLVSEIWGLQVRIASADGTSLLRGDFAPAAFIDIWDRSTDSAGGDTIAGANYQSVLSNLQWGDVSGSPFLSALRQAAIDGELSIKFNVDSFNMDFKSPDFMTGRIVGTIGPSKLGEPQHLVIGRQFMAVGLPPAQVNFFGPAGGINFCAGVVDPSAGCIYLDLGNALSTGADGAINDVGDLTLSVYDPIATPGNPAGGTLAVGTIPAKGPTGYAANPRWYASTAGVLVLPIPSALLPLVQNSPLALTGKTGVQITEWSSGAFVRADRYVYRMSPGDQVEIPVYAMQWGRPLGGAVISFVFDESQLQSQVGDPGPGSPYIAPSPPVATSPDALSYASSGTTDGNGLAVLRVTAGDPGTPRYFNKTPSNPGGDYGIDGQVYGLRPGFADTGTYSGPVNQWNFISFLVWSRFTLKVPSVPSWHEDLKPIFQQYANLYPVMNRFLNLGDYDSVVKNARLLSLAFGLNPADANSMPATRDLSPAKRSAILTWLKNPVLGQPAESKATPPRLPSPPAQAKTPDATRKGGKAAAAARRLILQRR